MHHDFFSWLSWCPLTLSSIFATVRTQQRLAGWKSHLLSISGRRVLLCLVMSVIPLHLMQTFRLPSWLARQPIKDGPILLVERQRGMFGWTLPSLLADTLLTQIKWRFGDSRSQTTKFSASDEVVMEAWIWWSVTLDNHYKKILWSTIFSHHHIFLLSQLERPILTTSSLYDTG